MDELDQLSDVDEFVGIDIGVLLADPGAESAALARWSERLDRYVQQQGALDALRLRSTAEAPWPQDDNAMLGYLIDRAAEIGEAEGADAAIAWLASHAWFEATIAERSRLARLIVDDD